MQVQDLMNQSVVSVEPEESAALCARLLARHKLGALPVCTAQGQLVGMVTDRDVTVRCVAAEEDPAATPVSAIMTRDCAVISPREDARAAARVMAARQVRRLPVVDDGRVVGMIALGDLATCRRFDMEASKAFSDISENVTRY